MRRRHVSAKPFFRLPRYLLLGAGLCAATLAFGAQLPPDLAQAARDYDAAQLHGDRAELERLLADDYTLVNSRARVEDKAGLIADYTAPGFKLDPFTIEQPIEKLWRDGAVLGGVVSISGSDGGKAFAARFRFADVWARRGGRWQVIFTEVTPVPTSP